MGQYQELLRVHHLREADTSSLQSVTGCRSDDVAAEKPAPLFPCSLKKSSESIVSMGASGAVICPDSALAGALLLTSHTAGLARAVLAHLGPAPICKGAFFLCRLHKISSGI